MPSDARPLVKVCGITREDDGWHALSAGADLLGFILARSPRRVTAKRAARLVRHLRGHRRGRKALMVGVFMDAPLGWLLKTCRGARFDLVQLHGRESPEYAGKVAAGGFRVMKVIKKLGAPAVAAMGRYGEAWAFLLEPGSKQDVPGRRGEPAGVDFRRARKALAAYPRVGIAGGLGPGNVTRAIRAAGPGLWLVDAASSLESFPGVKDPVLVGAFVSGARGRA